MTTAVITARRNQNWYRQPAQLVLGPTSATFVVVALISVLALLYLNQVTKTSVFNYQLADLTAQRDAVLSQTRDLQVEAGRLQSIDAIANSNVAKGMVPVSNVTYAQ